AGGTVGGAAALEPSVVLFRFQGFRVMPVSGLSLDGLHPNSVVVVFPTRHAPVAFTRSDAGESTGAIRLSAVRDPDVQRTPLTAVRSLIETGSPASGPTCSPDMIAASTFRAASNASSGVTVTNGLRT